MSDDEEQAELMTAFSGIPDMSDEQKENGESKMTKMVVFLCVFPYVIGCSIAYCIDHFGGANEPHKAMIHSTEYYWVYLGYFVVAWTIHFINNYPMIKKGKVMQDGNIRANMMIYRVNSTGEAVVLEDRGDVGEYNRANRSLHHMNETMAALLPGAFLAGFVYAKASFVCLLIFSIGRILHQQGYVNGYGGHGAGFALSMFSHMTIQSMVLIVGIEGLQGWVQMQLSDGTV